MTNVPTYTATAAYPHDNAERATSALRGALRQQVPIDKCIDWTTLEVSGPFTVPDGLGRQWFGYEATVTAH